MTMDPLVIPGVVRNGVVVPQGDVVLPEGAEVQITLPAALPPELQAEWDAWERLSDEAWGLISDWEKEGSSHRRPRQGRRGREEAVDAPAEEAGKPRHSEVTTQGIKEHNP